MSQHAGLVLASQVLNINAAAPVNSTPLPPYLNYIRVASTVHCHVKIHASDLATTQDYIIVPNSPEIFLTSWGDRVSILSVSGAGQASVSWLIY